MSLTAAKFGMACGLKNAMDTIRELNPYVAFAVNEECSARNECAVYRGFTKPVFNIEYPPLQNLMASTAKTRERYCPKDDQLKDYFHTVLKAKKLDGNVEYCDGKTFSTPTREIQEFNGGRGQRGSWVLTDPNQQGLSKNFRRSWQSDQGAVARMKKLAKRDGYPFREGPEKVIERLDIEGRNPSHAKNIAGLKSAAADEMVS